LRGRNLRAASYEQPANALKTSQREFEDREALNFPNAARKNPPTNMRVPMAMAVNPASAKKNGPGCCGPQGPNPPLLITPSTAAAKPPKTHQSPIRSILDTALSSAELWWESNKKESQLHPHC